MYLCTHAAITDESQGKECLNVGNNDITTLAVVLETTVTGGDFICADQRPVYTFSCTVHGNILQWHLNDERVTAFLPSDSVGRTVSVNYPQDSDPVYNIVTILTHASKTLDTPIPMRTSVFTIQPFNESQFEAEPFSVSCQTQCQSQPNVQVCQFKHLKIAGMLTYIMYFAKHKYNSMLLILSIMTASP